MDVGLTQFLHTAQISDAEVEVPLGRGTLLTCRYVLGQEVCLRIFSFSFNLSDFCEGTLRGI